jgi:mono/diheme cytochrome c family protein
MRKNVGWDVLGFLRWLLRVTIVSLLVLCIALGVVYWRSNGILAERVVVHETTLTLPTDADALERGRHVAVTRGCNDCHAADFGGKMIVDVLPVGRIAAPNITHGKGGLPANFGVDDWERVIRHGIAPDGRMLLVMPARDFAALTDADTADMIAYLQQLPPVDRTEPAVSIGPIPRLQMLIGLVPLAEARVVDQHAKHVAAMTAAPSPEYGRYLAHTCTGCHGDHLSGGRVPGLPPSFPAAANITPDSTGGIGRWKKADFYTAMRYGRRPNGTNIDPFMPWGQFKQMTDIELDALWAYLQTLPARPAGGR